MIPVRENSEVVIIYPDPFVLDEILGGFPTVVGCQVSILDSVAVYWMKFATKKKTLGYLSTVSEPIISKNSWS